MFLAICLAVFANQVDSRLPKHRSVNYQVASSAGEEGLKVSEAEPIWLTDATLLPDKQMDGKPVTIYLWIGPEENVVAVIDPKFGYHVPIKVLLPTGTTTRFTVKGGVGKVHLSGVKLEEGSARDIPVTDRFPYFLFDSEMREYSEDYRIRTQ